jgi:CHAT domain-containing protein/tetratricopeptide (TPR) repeat protein
MSIDVRERADLRTRFQDLGAYMAACSECGAGIARDLGLVVVGMAEEAPVVLACPDEHLAQDDPFAPSRELLDATNRSLYYGGVSLPGPVLAVPFDVLAIALGRDVDSDAAEPDAAVAAVAAISQDGNNEAERYAIFLDHVAGSRPERRMNMAWDALLEVGDLGSLRQALEQFPELIEDGARERSAAIRETALAAGDEHAVRIAEAQIALLKSCAVGDPEGGWSNYEAVALGFSTDVLHPQIDPYAAAFEEIFERDRAGAAAAGEELLAKAAELGMRPLEAETAVRTATAYYEQTDGDASANLERCRELLERALELVERDPGALDEATHTQALLNLGATYSSRMRGDPDANRQRAIGVTEQVLVLVSREDDGHSWAIAHTNLGMNLADQERYDEALKHFDAALTWRSFDRDPGDYAYTQVNLALTLMHMGGRARLEASLEHGSEAVRGYRAAGDALRAAHALGNIASARHTMADLDDVAEAERRDLLDEAERDARGAIALGGGDASANVAAGRRWAQLAAVLATRDGFAEATVDAHERALAELRPDSDPRGARDVARRLGALAADAGAWDIAASAWERAAVAGAAAVEARATRRGRLEETAANLTIFRWAAYALTRNGQADRAVEILELGRGRQLNSWLQRDIVDVEPLRRADRALCARFLEVRERVEHAERTGAALGDPAVAGAVEELAAVLAEVRALEGLEGFLLQPGIDEVVRALPEGEIVAYPVTSPYGSVWLLAEGGANTIGVIDLPGLTSTEIVHVAMRIDEASGRVAGYMVEQPVTGARLDDEIRVLGELLGPELLQPMADVLVARSIDGVTIVPLGTLGQMPLHAFGWTGSDGRPRCLLDVAAVAYAPSALLRSVSLGRADGHTGFPRLVAVGNPLPQDDPLPASALEARAVAASVPAAETDVLVEEAATKGAVLAALDHASHLHLACHGSAVRDVERLDGGLSFADNQVLTGAEILELDLSSARLVVASACETGIVVGYDAVEEAVALSTLFLAAGAASSVASLWQVSDYATALLMMRFYEELALHPEAPAQALRVAELWLRDLDRDEEERYVARRPVLRNAAKAMELSLGRGQGIGAGGTAGFGAPTLWAAFTFNGA